MTRSGEYAGVRDKGTARSGRLMTVAYLKDDTLPSIRFGFTLTKRLGNAVKRNLMRRRLREITRAAAPGISSKGRIVTIPRRDGIGAEFDAIRAEWHYLVRKLKLLPPAPPAPPVAVEQIASPSDPQS